MKFQTRLYIGFGIVIVMAFLISLIMVITTSRLNSDIGVLVNDKYKKVRLATDLRNNFISMDQEVYQTFIDAGHSEIQLEELSHTLSETAASSKDLMKELEQIAFLPEAMDLLDRIQFLHNEYIRISTNVIALLREDHYDDAIHMVYEEITDIRDELDDKVFDFKSLQEREMEVTLDKASSDFQTSITISVILAVLLLISIFGIAIWSVSSIRKSLRGVSNVIKQVKHSDPLNLPRIQITVQDEIGSIADAYNHMADSLEEKTIEQQKHALELEGQYWLKSMVAEISTGYQGIEDIKALAHWFITKVTPMVNANYGVLYLKEEDVYVKTASYAGDGSDIGTAHIKLNEGLVGQCAAEQRIMVINHPPANYIKIQSGTGHASPAQIVIMPITYNGVTEGVLELAAFHEINELQMMFLQEVIDTLGVTISSIAGQMQVQRLLKEAQIFTEELQTQSEELQQQQEELTTLNEQLGDEFKLSEQKNKQLELLKKDLESKNEQLLLASQYKSEFLANISHELRTPLNSILVLSQVLAENKDQQLSDKQLEYVQTIHSSGDELLKLINEVLDLSKIESGKMNVMLEEVKAKEIVDASAKSFQLIADKHGIGFHIHVDPSLEHLTLHTDGQKVQQIINNLLSNAIKFTKHGQVDFSLYIAAGDELGMDQDLEWLAFEIKDTGIGIPRDKLELIFESFQQVDGTTSRKYGGTGLGLAISKQLATLLRGFIRVSSQAGLGSTFTLYIPLSTELHAESLEESTVASKNNKNSTVRDIAPVYTESISSTEDQVNRMDRHQIEGKKILLIDDDMRNIYALTSALESYGLHVIFSENGEDGLQMLQEHPDTDLVLMDIMMPKMDGYEAIRYIRESEQFRDLPIIALTAKAMKEDKAKCIQAGANDYISKPIHIDQLLSLIHVWLYRLE